MVPKRKTVGFFYGAVAVLLLTATFADLALSQTVYNPQNAFGRFFETWGEWPGTLVALFSAAALFVTRNRDAVWKNVLSALGIGLLVVLFAFMSAFTPLHYLKASMPVVVAGAAVLAACAFFLATRVKPQHRNALHKAAVVGVLLLIGAIVVINVLKYFWGRPRFRSMDDPLKQFTAWYLPQALAAGNEFMSFPSGHSANAAVVVWVVLLPGFVPALQGKERYLGLCAGAWLVCVMYSRIIMGAHFLSDVTMGAALSVTLFFLLCGWKYAAKKPEKQLSH